MEKLAAFIILVCMGLSIMTLYNDYKIKQEEAITVTEDIADYNSAEYPLESFDVFLDEIPDEANVISYHYRKIYRSYYDICLETRFDTTEQIDSYILKIKEKFLNNHSENPIVQRNGWAIIEENPHDSEYIDVFLTYTEKDKMDYFAISSAVGFKYKSVVPYFSGSYQLISYSYEKLIVRQFCTYDTIQYYLDSDETAQNSLYTPQYFLKFDVPLDKDVERIFPLNYGY